MALIPWLQSQGVTHGFTLNNEGTSVADDFGDSVDPTNISGGTYSFQPEPICLGMTHTLRSTTSTAENVDGAIFDNRNDINGSNGGGNDSSSFDYVTGTKQICFWASQRELFNVTCMYEQGAGVNNFQFMGGARVTFAAADAGQPFLIVPDNVLSQQFRSIFHGGGWEHHSQHAGSENQVWKTANGVIQGFDKSGGTAQFPSHSGDIVIGNSADDLKTFNENTLTSETVAQDSNLLLMFNNLPSIGEGLQPGDFHPLHREIFERTTRSEHLITGTVAQQQAQIDALSGTEFSDVNCAIEIRQATDATDYTLTLDNITFVQNEFLRDISIMYVGPNTLTIINGNGSNAVEVATPAERDLDLGTTIIAGGGSIIVQETVTLTIGGIVSGAIVSIYDEDSADPQDLGTELQRNNSAGVLESFNYFSTKAGDDVTISHLAPGFKQLQQRVTLPANDTLFQLEPQQETN